MSRDRLTFARVVPLAALLTATLLAPSRELPAQPPAAAPKTVRRSTPTGGGVNRQSPRFVLTWAQP